MRTVLTPQGLDLSFRLRVELGKHKRQSSVSPNQEVEKIERLMPKQQQQPRSQSVHPTRPSTGMSRSPQKPSKSPQRLLRVQNRFSLLVKEREAIMRRIKVKAEEARETSQRCVLSFITLDATLPSLSNDRAIYLKNLREAQNKKYAKAWGWVSSKGFASARRRKHSSQAECGAYPS